MTTNHIPAITYPTILIAVFANQVCLPVPAVLFLMTAGALVASGSLNLGSVYSGRRSGLPNGGLCMVHRRSVAGIQSGAGSLFV